MLTQFQLWHIIGLIGFVGLLFMLFAVYACCVIAGRADREMAEWEAHMREKKPPDGYNEDTRYHWF